MACNNERSEFDNGGGCGIPRETFGESFRVFQLGPIDGVNFIPRAMRWNDVDVVERARPSSLSLTLASPDYGRADLIIAISWPAVRDRCYHKLSEYSPL